MEKDPCHRCPLCGRKLAEAEQKCEGCLISKEGELLCCPPCGYSYRGTFCNG